MDLESNTLESWFLENKISEIECLVPDMAGNARGKFIPSSQFLRGRDAKLPEGILVQTVTGEYSDNHWEIVSPTDEDMNLLPDVTTARLVPWAKEPTAQIIYDCYKSNGDHHPLSTRNILRQILALYRDYGLIPVVAPEVEFYLVSKNINPDNELIPPKGRSGRRETTRLSYSIDAISEFENFVEDMYEYAEIQGLGVDSLVHENGAAQLEINFQHGDPLKLADEVFIFKRTVREVALKHDMFATFMAKPMEKEPGSALHIHQSILNHETGENIFSDREGEPSDRFFSYIGGLQKYTPELISFYAPNVNSYRRLAPDISAPITLNWGFDNRTVAFRVPHSDAKNKRVENRFPGADVNPYLANAATLGTGLLGILENVAPTKPYQGTANEDEIQVARTLEEALRKLGDSDQLSKMFGKNFLEAYSAVKLDEFEEFNRVISSWEREHLLLQV